MSIFDGITDLFFGGAEKDAAKEMSRAQIEAGRLGLQGSREAIQYLREADAQARLDTRPLRYGGGSAYNAYLAALGLPQQDFADRTLPATVAASGGVPSVVSGGVPQSSGGNAVSGAVNGALGGYLGEQAANLAFRTGAGDVLAGAIGQDATGALLDYAGPIGAALGGYLGTKGRSTTARLGSGALSAAGYYFGGPIGGAIGGALGSVLAGKHDPRYGVSIGPGGQLIDDQGNDLGRIELPQSGLQAIPNISRDGHQILVDPEGNLYSGVKNGGQMVGGVEVLPLGGGFNVNQGGQGFVALPGATNTSGGTQFQPYLGGNIGIPSGEQPGALIDGSTGMVIDEGANANVRGTADLGAYGGFQQSPGYQFALDEMQKGINRAASASGDLGSGRHLKDMSRYTSGYANQEFQNYLGNLQNAFAPGTAAIQQTAAQSGATGAGSANLLSRGYLAYGDGIAQGGLLRGEGTLLSNNARRSSIFDLIGMQL